MPGEVEFEVQGLYSGTWEMVTTENTRPAADEQLAPYRENEPETRFRVKRVRTTKESA